MVYYPIRNAGIKQKKYIDTTLADKGINLNDLPQFLDIRYALNIENYFTLAQGRLLKRGGLKRFFEHASSTPATMFKKFTNNVYLFAYSNKLYSYTISTDTIASIKTDFTTTDRFEGIKYGDYFFICNGITSNNIGRISQTLAYDTQTANYTVGKILTGGTSGAKAIILEDADGGAAGTLTLGQISGVFQNNETITDNNSSPGSALVNGALSYTYTEITGAPKAKYLYEFGGRLYAGGTDKDETEVRGSAVDTGTNPPFTNWTAGTGSTDPLSTKYGNAGAVKSIISRWGVIIVFGENGRFGFKPTVIDSSGTLVQDNQPIFYSIDIGGTRGVIDTPHGIFYATKNGLFLMNGITENQTENPKDKYNISVIPLGNTYFDDCTFTDADMAYDEKRELILLTMAKDSSNNNIVIVYDINRKAFSKITGWNINRFLKDGQKIYACSATTYSSPLELRTWEIFENYDDDGSAIFTDYIQEIPVGGLTTRKSIVDQYFQGKLSMSTSIRIAFDIYTRDEVKVTNKKVITWDATNGITEYAEYGSAPYVSPYGGGSDDGNMVENFSGCSAKIRNFKRLQLHLTENSKVPHEINFISLGINKEIPIRKRNLTHT